MRDATRFRQADQDELTVTTTDTLDAGALAPVLAGHEAVVPAIGRNLRGGNRIPRADLAHAILDSVDDDTACRTTRAVAT